MSGYGEFSYYYDLLTENVDYESRCNYITALLAENGVSKGILLDLACGTGTMSLLLREKGYDVIGVDASEGMLMIAQDKKYEAEADDIIFLCQKMEELDLFGTINAAVCTLDSINHVTQEETVREIFRRVSLFMEDKGIFIFDVNTPYKHKDVLGNNTFVYEIDDTFCVWQNTTDESLLTKISIDVFEKDATAEEDDDEAVYYRITDEFCERGYDLELLKEMLSENKFEVIAVYEEMTREPVKDNTQRAVFVAKKHGTQ